MKKFMKILYVFLAIIVFVNLFACSLYEKSVGSGINGVVADFSWKEYDDLIASVRETGKSKERDNYLHKAEEMLMDEACVIPVYTICNKALCRKNLKNVYMDKSNLIHFENMYSEDGKNVINIQLYGEPDTLDPGLCHYSSEHTFLSNIYGTLVKYDKDGNLINVFLDHFELSNDELTWRLILKDNLKWSDGKPLTAKDFEYTLKRNANTETGGPLSFIFNSIKGYPNNLNVKAIDDRTFEVKLSNKCPYFLSLFTSAAYIPLREDIVEKSKDWYLTVPNVSCGPYILKEWNHKESMVFEKNPYFFDAKSVKTERINLMLNSSATSVYSAYYAGDLDFALSIPETAEGDDVVVYKTMGMEYIRMNVKSKMFNGLSRDEAKKLRKAISYCIDRQFIEDMSYNLKEKSYSFVNDLFTDSEDKKFLRNTENYNYPYENGYFYENLNLDKARELLKEIGYHFDEKGKVIEDITFEMMGSQNEFNSLSIIQADLEKIGINMKIRKRDDAFGNAGKYDMMLTGWFPDYDDPLAMLELYTSDNTNNTCYIGRPIPTKNREY